MKMKNNFMTLEEMRKHEWSINWSGGKDSTATIIACIKKDIPIKEINYVRMMFDDKLPATLPIMTDFVDNCITRFTNQYGLNVNIVKSESVMDAVANKVYSRSKYEQLNGTRYTLGCLSRGICKFNACKVKALKSITGIEYEMIGYAIDETERIHRLNHPYQESILCTLAIKEEKCFDICKRNNMLSPLYELGFKRDGCWFCPNTSKFEIEYIKKNYPKLVKIIYDEFDERPKDFLFASKNNWVQSYLTDCKMGGLNYEGDKSG